MAETPVNTAILGYEYIGVEIDKNTDDKNCAIGSAI